MLPSLSSILLVYMKVSSQTNQFILARRRVKPTVQKEAAGGNAVIESVLWDAVPSYLRKLDAQCRVVSSTLMK